MRVVGGRLRSRPIAGPKSDGKSEGLRPTADRLREALFNILMHAYGDPVAGARVLDLFAGSGALGLEALSRGAREAHFVELAVRSLAALRDNIRVLGAEAEAVVHRGDALRFIEKVELDAFDVVFADPPYRLGMAQRVAEQWLEHPFSRVLGVEHEKSLELPGAGDRRVYGDTVLTFYRGS